MEPTTGFEPALKPIYKIGASLSSHVGLKMVDDAGNAPAWLLCARQSNTLCIPIALKFAYVVDLTYLVSLRLRLEALNLGGSDF